MSGERVQIKNKETGEIINDVLDVSPELLGTTLHIIVPQIMTKKRLKYFMYPFLEKDLQDWELMNNRKKCLLFMSEQMQRRDLKDKRNCAAEYYLGQLAVYYKLLHYNASLKNTAVECVLDSDDMKEYDKVRGIERKG